MTNERILQVARILLRFALGVTFLVSVADRFGALGPNSARNVSWGDWKHFVQYVAVLNWFVPKALIPALSVLEQPLKQCWVSHCCSEFGNASSPGVVLVCCFPLL
jgi:hypothetical protein